MPRIPAPLKGTDAGSFAQDTIVRRLPEIARRVLNENHLTAEVSARIEALIHDLPHGKIRMFADNGPASETWQQAIAGYADHNWLEVPWFFAETYFYRRILEATGFFRSGPGEGKDPFVYQKQLGLESARSRIQALTSELQSWVSLGPDPEQLSRLFLVDLWGNQLDLSLWPADGEGKPDHSGTGQQNVHLLVNDTALVIQHILSTDQPGRIDIVVDNAGFELVCDLCLADYLLSTDMVAMIKLHLKAHPTFVSDATVSDVMGTLVFLDTDAESGTSSLAARLEHHVARGRLHLSDDPFWTSPLAAWEMPGDLKRELGQAQLVISKGDANFRRLVGDRHWEHGTPFEEILAYFPTSLASLRTLKSEVVVGFSYARIKEMNQRDVNWMTNGKWGTIQFAALR